MKTSGINLIPIHRLESCERRTRTRFWITVVVGYAVVVASVSGAGYSYRRDDQARVYKAIGDSKANAENETQQLAEAIKQLKQAEAKLNLLHEISDQPDWSLLLDYLARVKGDNVVLEDVHMTPHEVAVPIRTSEASEPSMETNAQEQFDLEIKGAGKSTSDVTAFVLQLERSGVFQRVTLVQTNRAVVWGADASTFTIVCELRG